MKEKKEKVVENEFEFVWIFVGSFQEGISLPSGVFKSKELALNWIRNERLSGILTKYPLDISVHDWALSNKYIKEKKGAKQIQVFSSIRLEHFHFEDGV